MSTFTTYKTFSVHEEDERYEYYEYRDFILYLLFSYTDKLKKTIHDEKKNIYTYSYGGDGTYGGFLIDSYSAKNGHEIGVYEIELSGMNELYPSEMNIIWYRQLEKIEINVSTLFTKYYVPDIYDDSDFHVKIG